MNATLVLGAGPAGLGPIVFAAQSGLLEPWLDRGVAVVERRPAASSALSRYALFADSFGTSFLEASDDARAHPLLSRVHVSAETAALRPYRDARPPLDLVGAYLARLETEIEGEIRSHPRCTFARRREIVALHVHEDRVAAYHIGADGASSERHEAHTAVVALGGEQSRADGASTVLGRLGTLGALAGERLVLADEVLTLRGAHDAFLRLAAAARPEVVVVGGSHSAFSVAWLLTQRAPELLGAGAVTILCRRPPRIFYRSVEDACADGYLAFGKQDLCPRTARVHQLGGLRGDGRELWRRMTGRPGTEREHRVVLRILETDDGAEIVARLRRATLVVAAVGYRPRMPRVVCSGAAIALKADEGGPSVDDRCRLLSAEGTPIRRVFTLGLASGFIPSGDMGGEPSFRGHTNGVWLYQHHIGARVHREIAAVLERDGVPLASNGADR
jgi:hypothetical protein